MSNEEKNDVENNNKKYNPIVFTNIPIKENENDLLGINTDVNRIEQAIDEGANIIGIIGDYGTGKSSLIEFLKNRFNKTICINMWNSVDTDNIDVLGLTKNFVFQLAIGKGKQFAQYINKRLSKNFNVLSVSISTLRYWKCAIFSVITYFIYKICSELPKNIYETSLYKTLSNNGKIDLISDDNTANFIKSLYGGAIDFRYIFLLIALILLFRLLYKNVMAVISSGATKGEKKEDNNDIYGVYLEVANEISNMKIKKKKDENKREDKVLVIIEDLDRINKKQDVKNFIKEIYKFNNVLPEKTKEKIVYLIAIKQEESLSEVVEKENQVKNENSKNNVKKQDENEKIFSKIFSYKTILNPIHHSDYNKVLLELLKQKKEFVESCMEIELGEELPKDFFYITKGKNLTIREIKDRLNRSFELYENIKEKSTTKNKAVEYIKCAIVAYLESQYPSDIKRFILNDQDFSKVIEASYTFKQDKILKNSEKVKRIKELINSDYSEKFVNEISEMIVNGLIDDDFRVYFYNYPKGQRMKTISEKYVEDLLLYPNDETQINEDKIKEALKNNSNIVIDCFERRKNEKLLLPNSIFESSILFKQALDYFEDNLIELMQKEIKWKSENIAESGNILSKICKFGYDISNILEKYSEKLYIEIQQLNEKEIERARAEIIKASQEYVKCFKSIFINDGIPLITKSELDLIENEETKMDLINEKIIDEHSFSYIKDLLNKSNLNEEEYIKAKNIYYEIGNNIDLEEYPDELLEFLNNNNKYDANLFEYIYNSFISDRNSIDMKLLENYLNTLPINIYDISFLTMIDNMKLECKLNKQILKLLKEKELYKTYWINMIAFDKSDELNIKDDINGNLLIINEISEIIGIDIIKFRKNVLKKKLANEYKEIFKGDFPIITQEEMQMVDNVTTLINIIDFSKITISNLNEFVNRINDIYVTREDLLQVINIFGQDKISEIAIISQFIDNLIWKDDVVEQLTTEDKIEIYNILNIPLKLSNPNEALKFLKKTKFLIESVEEQIYSGIKNGIINKEDYIDLINDIDAPTEETIKIITTLKLYNGFTEKITNELYEKKYYDQYIISKTLWDEELKLQLDKIPIENYINVYNTCDEVYYKMVENTEFLQIILNEGLYEKIETNEKLKPLYKLRQPIKFVKYLIDRLSENEFFEYLEEKWHLNTEEDSLEFQRLICKDKYIKYIKGQKYYYIVLEKLWNPAQKGQVTRNRNKYLSELK